MIRAHWSGSRPPDNFIFIDDNLEAHTPNQTNGLITITGIPRQHHHLPPQLPLRPLTRRQHLRRRDAGRHHPHETPTLTSPRDADADTSRDTNPHDATPTPSRDTNASRRDADTIASRSPPPGRDADHLTKHQHHPPRRDADRRCSLTCAARMGATPSPFTRRRHRIPPHPTPSPMQPTGQSLTIFWRRRRLGRELAIRW